MKDSEKREWLTLYECTQKIGEFDPWKRFNEDCCFTYIWNDKELFYSFIKDSIGKCGIACYIGEKNYLTARKRLTAPNTKEEPVFCLQDGFVCIWDDRNSLSKADYDMIKELGLSFRGKGNWLHFDRYEIGYWPVPITTEDVGFLIEAFGNLHMMLRAIYEDRIDPHFDEGYKLLRWYDPDTKLYYTHYFVVDMPGDIIKPPVVTLGENPFIDKAKGMPTSDVSIQVDWSYVDAVYYDEQNRETFPLLFLGIDSKTNVVLFQMMLPPGINKANFVLNYISRYIDKSGKPREFTVCDEELRNILDDYCRKTGIKLKFKKTLPAMKMLRSYMINHLDG